MTPISHRKLKARVLALLQAEDFDPGLPSLAGVSARRIVNPLFGLLYHGDHLVRWRAVSSMGTVVAGLADADLESARVVMRRLMWNLNDESGGIGWGSPEAMGDIMARHERLADEYSSILISYLDPAGNFLEHEGLQQGVLWGVGRLARTRPERTAAAVPHIIPFFSNRDPQLRGLALWSVQPMADESIKSLAGVFIQDDALVRVYHGGQLRSFVIAELAERILESESYR